MEAFYSAEGSGFRSTVSTRGPWSNDFQHGGPPSALLARAFERLLPPGFALTRMTVEFFRPVPVAQVDVDAEVVRGGKKVAWMAGRLTSGGKEILKASAVAMRNAPVNVEVAGPDGQMPPPDASAPFTFPFFQASEGYHTAMEVRIARGEWSRGALAAWMRMRVPLVEGEDPSPLQRVVCAADSGGGISKVLDIDRFTFMNVDLTVHLHRPAVSEWVCLDARTLVQGEGVGLAECELYDTRGSIGRSVQGLLLDRRGAS